MENRHTSPTTSELQPSVERTTEQQEALDTLISVDEFTKVRENSTSIYDEVRTNELLSGKTETEADEMALSAMNAWHTEAIDTFTSDNHLNDDDSLALKDLTERYSVANVSDDEWNLSKYDDDGNKIEDSMSEQFDAEVKSLFTPQESTNSLATTVDTLPLTIQERAALPEVNATEQLKRTRLDELRDAAAEASAQSQGKMGGRSAEYDALMTEYHAEIIKQANGDPELQAILENPNATALQKNAAKIEYLLKEDKHKRESSEKILKNTPRGKIVKFLTSGSFAQRTIKGLILGGAVGAGATLIGGAVAGVAGAAVVTGVAVGTFRFVKGFAQFRAKHGQTMEISKDEHENIAIEALPDEFKSENDDTIDDSQFEAIQSALATRYEQDTDREQRKNVKSAVAGIATVGIAALFSGAVVQAAQETGAVEKVAGWAGGNIAKVWEATGGKVDWPWGNAVEAPDADVTESAAPTEEAVSGPTLEVDPENAAPVVPEHLQAADIDPDFTVEPDEGGISLFEGLGLTENQWNEIQPILHEKYPNEVLSNGYLNKAGPLSPELQKEITQYFHL